MQINPYKQRQLGNSLAWASLVIVLLLFAAPRRHVQAQSSKNEKEWRVDKSLRAVQAAPVFRFQHLAPASAFPCFLAHSAIMLASSHQPPRLATFDTAARKTRLLAHRRYYPPSDDLPPRI